MLNLFLALLLNAFASDSLRKAKEDSEDNKLKLAFRRIYDLCCCCLKKKNATVNSVVPNEEGEEVSMNEMGNKNGKYISFNIADKSKCCGEKI